MCKNFNCEYIKEKEKQNCPVKLKEILSNMNSLEKTKMYVEIFHLKWGKMTLHTIVWSLLIIFTATIVDIFFGTGINDKYNLKIFSSLQVWVGLILGIIATLFSIISMFLSFYNLQQQQESEKIVRELNEKLLEQLSREMKKTLENELAEIKKQLIDQKNRLGNIEKNTLNKRNDNVTLSEEGEEEITSL